MRLTDEAERDGQQAYTPGNTVVLPSGFVHELREDEVGRAARGQNDKRNDQSNIECNVADTTNQLDEWQQSVEKDIDGVGERHQGPHQHRAVPSLEFVFGMIQHK